MTLTSTVTQQEPSDTAALHTAMMPGILEVVSRTTSCDADVDLKPSTNSPLRQTASDDDLHGLWSHGRTGTSMDPLLTDFDSTPPSQVLSCADRILILPDSPSSTLVVGPRGA